MDEQQEYKKLAKKMVEKIREIRYTYPLLIDSIESLQEELQNRMIKLAQTLSRLNDRERDMLTLLVLNEVHKTVDEIFSEVDEQVPAE